jgi:hypothetical protein
MARRQLKPANDPMELSAMAPAIGDHLEIGDEDELDELDNPDVEELSDAPMIGSRSRPSDLFGESAETFGRATSPKLYAAAGRMPTATQYRVWKWENGVPVALGVIDVEASEEDFVRQFSSAMPRKGEGRGQYRLRPIDIRGQELGKEFTVTISEHHATLSAIRSAESEDRDYDARSGRGDVHVHGGGAADSTMAEEMGRMFESAVENAERRTELLQQQLEQERERIRSEDARRAEERVGLAERSAEVVQRMTERLMASDRARSEEALNAQKDQGQFLVQTLTAVFSQQQVASREQHDRMREADMARLSQDREFFERQRQEMAAQRQHEREEEDRRRSRERDEWERRREMEKAEMQARIEQAKMEMELRRLEIEKERDRARIEIDERRRADREEYERKQVIEREERERRERMDRERWERERQDWDRRETLRREELQREERVRSEQLVLQQKALEVTAQKDREHAERMMELARQEREAQREAQGNRERMEREGREAADRERQRQHELQIKEMEMAKERDREHAERMIQLSKDRNSGGLSGLTEMLGMDTSEVLGKIFGAGGGGEGEEAGGWKAALPAVLGALATAFAPKGPAEPATPDIPAGAAMVNTPNGPRLIPMNALAALQQQQMQPGPRRAPAMVGGMPRPLPNLPAESSIPSEYAEQEAPAPEPEGPPEPELPPEYKAAEGVNCLGRAKAAGLPLSKQKSARKALRELVEQYGSTAEEKWTEMTTAAVLSAPSIIDYLSAVGIWAALVEAKAEPDLAVRVVAALKGSGLIPDSIPFTEEDVAAKAKKEDK